MNIKKFLADHWKELSSAIGTVIAGLAGWLWRKVLRRKMKKFRADMLLLEMLPNYIGEYEGMKTELAKLQESVQEILKLIKPNGGSSVSDSLSRLEQGLHNLQQVRWTIEDMNGSAIWQTDRQGKTVYASSALADMYGLDQRDVIGNGWVAAVCSEDRNRVFQEWKNVVAQGRRFDDTYRITQPDTKATILVNAKALPVHDAQGEITGYVGILQRMEH